MGSITLSEAWPVLSGILVLLVGIIAYFLRRIDDDNRKEHERSQATLQGAISAHSERNDRQHAEFYERIRDVELDMAAIRAEHSKNHP